MTTNSGMKPYIDEDGLFHYDTLTNGIWYAMCPKPGLGARAIPVVKGLIQKFNQYLQKENDSTQDFISIYAPTYRKYMAGGRISVRVLFPSLIFIHSTPEVIQKFIQTYPYQLFFLKDRSVTHDTNHDEYGNPTHDTYMRIRNKAVGEMYVTLETYNQDIRVFTAEELQNLKYTHQVEIVDGPLAGQICRIKTIEGKKRVIVQILDGLLGVVLLMPSTHFKKI